MLEFDLMPIEHFKGEQVREVKFHSAKGKEQFKDIWDTWHPDQPIEDILKGYYIYN